METWAASYLSRRENNARSSLSTHYGENNQQWEKVKQNITTAMQNHLDEGPVRVVGDWNIKNIDSLFPNDLNVFIFVALPHFFIFYLLFLLSERNDAKIRSLPKERDIEFKNSKMLK